MSSRIFSVLQFFSVSDEVIDNANDHAHKIFAQMRMLSTTITSFALGLNESWPNVTLANFDLRAQETESLTHAELIAFAPILRSDQTTSWEHYADEHQGWIQDDLKLRGWDTDPGFISTFIHPFPNGIEDKSESDLVLPLWQLGPVPHDVSVIKLDLFTHPVLRPIILESLTDRHKQLSPVVDVDFLIKATDEAFVSDGHPRSVLVQPVFEDFSSNQSVVGFLLVVIPWEPYFDNVLPLETPPVTVYVNDTCNSSSFTYQIVGHRANLTGLGDLHNRDFTALSHRADFAAEARTEGPEPDQEASSHHACDYSVTVFATIEFQSSYTSWNPAVYTTVIVLVFALAGLMFLVYDLMVEYRQRKLLRTAQRTDAIVASLFPKEVQERMLADAEEKAKEAKASNKLFGLAPKSQLQDFLKDGEAQRGAENSHSFTSKPIADLFPTTTVMFADLVGFTAWSSTREPSHVFMLLETIFHEFDVIAKRRRVFKVETVGDCYVAVCGLPEPRKDHAIVMARFARDCLYRMNTLTKQLELTLGPDTSDLGVRVGLHSGPVTAGVLRGERARFQLFGGRFLSSVGSVFNDSALAAILTPRFYLPFYCRHHEHDGPYRDNRSAQSDPYLSRDRRLVDHVWKEPLARSARRQGHGEGQG